MNLINNYNDHMVDMLLESIKNDEISLIFSDKLLSYFTSIKHPISKTLIDFSKSWDYDNFKITLLDLVDKKDKDGNLIPDVISFVQSNKAIEQIAKLLNIEIIKGSELDDYSFKQIKVSLLNDYNQHFNPKSRSETTLGKIVNKLYPNEFKPSGDPGNDIESFVNMFKALRTGIPTFDLVESTDIVYYYDERQYGNPIGGSLWGSCMRYRKCADYIKFYSDNQKKVSMLILKDPENESKIVGRALVWKIDKLDGQEVEDRFFMDRIYYTYDYIVEIFKTYAKEQGWLYKSKQNMEEDVDIIDTVDGMTYDTVVVSDIFDPGPGFYPYLDTLKYFDSYSGLISNSTSGLGDYIELYRTDGGAEGLGDWSDYYEEYVNHDEMNYCELGDTYRFDDDCFYSDFYRATVASDYADRSGFFCDNFLNNDDWRRWDAEIAETRDGYTATMEYAEKNWVYSTYSDEWCEEAKYSKYCDAYIHSYDAVEVYLDIEMSETDWRVNDEETYFYCEELVAYYDKHISLKELKEFHKIK